jgi:hypothetical protein
MRNHPRFMIIAVSILVLALAPLLPIGASQQSQESRPQKSSEQNQPSPEALEKLRQLAAKQKTYQVGYNPALERKLTQLSGIEIPRGTVKQALQVRQEAKRKLAESIKRREQYYRENPDLIFNSVDVYELIRRELREANPGKPIPNNPPGLLPLLPIFNWRTQRINRTTVKIRVIATVAGLLPLWPRMNTAFTSRRPEPQEVVVAASGPSHR